MYVFPCGWTNVSISTSAHLAHSDRSWFRWRPCVPGCGGRRHRIWSEHRIPRRWWWQRRWQCRWSRQVMMLIENQDIVLSHRRDVLLWCLIHYFLLLWTLWNIISRAIMVCSFRTVTCPFCPPHPTCLIGQPSRRKGSGIEPIKSDELAESNEVLVVKFLIKQHDCSWPKTVGPSGVLSRWRWWKRQDVSYVWVHGT